MGLSAGLGSANVAIRATLDKLDGDLGSARGKIEGAVQQIAANAGKSLQTIGKMAIGGIGAAAGAVAGLGLALGKLAIDAAPVQGIQDAFEGLADSAGIGGDEMLAALQRGSSGMIPARDLMLSFNKAASLVGIDFAKELPSAMQYLGKVSASTGQDMGFLMDSLVTGVGRLSPMILDNLGIQVDLAGATQRASEMFGLEAGELSKSQIQAGMMNLALEKLAANTAAMPDVSQSAAAKLAQFKATIQDTKDQIGMAFLPTLTTLMGIISRLAETILPPLTSFLEGTLAPAFEKVAGVVENFLWMLDVGVAPIDALKMALSTLFGPEVAETITGIVTGIGEFIAKAQEVLAPVLEWIGKNVELQDVLLALGAAIATVVLPVLWGIVSAALPVIGVFLAVVAVVAALRTAWENDFLGIRTALTEFWEGTAKPALTDLWNWLSVNVPAALETLRAFWVDTAWPAIQTAIQTVWPIIETIFQSISSFITDTLIPTVTDLYNKWTQEVWPTIQTVTENVWTVISAIFEELGRWINDNIMPWVEALRALWVDTVWPAIQTALETAWAVIEPIWEALEKWLGTTLPPIISGLQTFFETAMTGISAAVQPVKDLWDALVTAVKGFWTWISGKVFNFKLNIPNLPDWATPGSPLPIHTAWKAFAEDMNRMTIHPEIELEALPALMRSARLASMQLMQAADMQLNGPGAMMARPGESSGGRGGTSVVIYGLTREGVQDAKGLLAELQGLAL